MYTCLYRHVAYVEQQGKSLVRVRWQARARIQLYTVHYCVRSTTHSAVRTLLMHTIYTHTSYMASFIIYIQFLE